MACPFVLFFVTSPKETQVLETMRKICLFGVFAALMFFGGCGEKRETKTESNEISNQAANIVEEPRVTPSGWD